MKLFSPARIHLGFLELDQTLPRFFGSMGLTVSNFCFEVQISKSKNLNVVTEHENLKKKTLDIFYKFKKKYDVNFCNIKIKKIIPSHIGLGSGTQFSLTIGYLISKINNLNISIDEIALFLNRGNRSGIGVQSFKEGGFTIDIGKKKDANNLPLKLTNIKWPQDWKIILLFDLKGDNVFGENEISKFEEVNKRYRSKFNYNYSTLFLKILPGIIEKDFNSFTEGIQLIQSNMSEIFYKNSKKFSSKNINYIFDYLRKKKIKGFGQTSWGPTGFIFCEDSKKRNQLLSSIEKYITLKKLIGVDLVKVNGRNKGKFLIKDSL
tara:strand:+ start:367 stop:1326 length:960 start_codon:yes stop_codon:yes gene_type:complete